MRVAPGPNLPNGGAPALSREVETVTPTPNLRLGREGTIPRPGRLTRDREEEVDVG